MGNLGFIKELKCFATLEKLIQLLNTSNGPEASKLLGTGGGARIMPSLYTHHLQEGWAPSPDLGLAWSEGLGERKGQGGNEGLNLAPPSHSCT